MLEVAAENASTVDRHAASPGRQGRLLKPEARARQSKGERIENDVRLADPEIRREAPGHVFRYVALSEKRGTLGAVNRISGRARGFEVGGNVLAIDCQESIRIGPDNIFLGREWQVEEDFGNGFAINRLGPAIHVQGRCCQDLSV